ncbi:BQ5605_C011g06535 [Microbotryum silenes-dioicae]|uniref:BQ5605_C011g06535 protein n=1 Tax=Microbotryum silenes-dioicae TaxID=796604 RepID=A0A2X0MA98_9BASI|nr:BQ5605_C011g06535 [Microbotryum silenes-dioicae]
MCPLCRGSATAWCKMQTVKKADDDPDESKRERLLAYTTVVNERRVLMGSGRFANYRLAEGAPFRSLSFDVVSSPQHSSRAQHDATSEHDSNASSERNSLFTGS